MVREKPKRKWASVLVRAGSVFHTIIAGPYEYSQSRTVGKLPQAPKRGCYRLIIKRVSEFYHDEAYVGTNREGGLPYVRMGEHGFLACWLPRDFIGSFVQVIFKRIPRVSSIK